MDKRVQSIQVAAVLVSTLLTAHASAAALGAGNIVVYRVGDGTTALTNNGNAVFLDEYTTTGTLVQSIAMPTAASGANNPLIGAGQDSSGMLHLSANGQYLTLTGYGATLGGSTNLTTSSSASISRVVAVVDASGSVNTTTALNFGSGNPIRSAITTDGTSLWITGGSGGIAYTTTGSSALTVANSTANWRDLTIAGGQLYVSTGSGTTYRVASVGSGTPTATGAALAELPGITSSNVSSPYAFTFADLSSTVAGADVLYIADGGTNTIKKFSLVAGQWTADGAVTVASGLYGLTTTTDASGNTILLAATSLTSASGGGAIYSFTDTTGYDGTVSGTATSIVTLTSGSNMAFRGIALAPVAVPEIASLTILSVLGLPLLLKRR